MPPHTPEPPDEDLESVLGATPHEFESRILRQCLTGHDVEGPHRSRWGPSTFVVSTGRSGGLRVVLGSLLRHLPDETTDALRTCAGMSVMTDWCRASLHR